MNPQRIGGFILLVAGVILLVIGLNASDSVSDRMSNFFTGYYTDRTVWYMVGGGLMAIVGVGLVAFGGRWARS